MRAAEEGSGVLGGDSEAAEEVSRLADSDRTAWSDLDDLSDRPEEGACVAAERAAREAAST